MGKHIAHRSLLLVCLLCGVSVACSGEATAPTPVIPASERIQLSVRDVTGVNRSPYPDMPWVAYSFCRSVKNLGPGTATIRTEMIVLGPAGDVLVSGDPNSGLDSLGTGGMAVGCGGHLRDYDPSHPVGVRYRLRYTLTYDDGASGIVEGEAAISVR